MMLMTYGMIERSAKRERRPYQDCSRSTPPNKFVELPGLPDNRVRLKVEVGAPISVCGLRVRPAAPGHKSASSCCSPLTCSRRIKLPNGHCNMHCILLLRRSLSVFRECVVFDVELHEVIRLVCSDNFDLGTQSDCHVLGSLMREEVHNQLMAMLSSNWTSCL